jgi:aspartyl-tRNA(Asn)/glutamyl-tRNA(Gln) amidotransferase subunit A
MRGTHTSLSSSQLPWCSIRELVSAIHAREISPLEVTEGALVRAQGMGRGLNAFITLDAGQALQEARRLTERLERLPKRRLPLAGVPITVKDLLATRGLPLTAGSRALGDRPAEEADALVVGRLRRAGAIVLGTTNLNEFAYGINGENHHFGQVLNPWDRGRSPGGSSSGSAAALSAGIGVGSVGTDTRGSIRIPASCCGITGFKPTRGLVPLRGVFPLSHILDHAGPMARSVEDVQILLRVMAGVRYRDGGGGGTPRAFLPALRVGLPSFFFRDLHPEVEGAVRQALGVLEEAGLAMVPLEIPELEPALRASAVIASSEALGVHDARLRDRPGDFGPAVRERLEGGYAHSALDLVQACTVRHRLRSAYRNHFRTVDIMAGPTLPGLPAPVGSPVMELGQGRSERLVDASCRLVAPQNMTGVPALSLPCGFSSEGLPLGLQLWGPRGADPLVLELGRLYQARTGWHRRRPPVD